LTIAQERPLESSIGIERLLLLAIGFGSNCKRRGAENAEVAEKAIADDD
jgi:hypothetical protein